MATGLIGAVVLGILALSQWREADEQKEIADEQKNIALARQLAAQAELESDQGGTYLQSGALLAAEAKQLLTSLSDDSSSLDADRILRNVLDLLSRPVASLPHTSAISGLAFSPDGEYLATASYDHTAHVQRWRPEGLVDEAYARLTCNLTKEEWQQKFGDEPYQKTCPNLPDPEE